MSILSAMKFIDRPGAKCGRITALLAIFIFVNVFSANAVLIKLSTSLYPMICPAFNTRHAFTRGRESGETVRN